MKTSKPSKPIELTPVESSQIRAIGYDAKSKTLHIQFHPKKDQEPVTYAYDNVTPSEHGALIGAESIGSHFYKTLKSDPKKWPFKKL